MRRLLQTTFFSMGLLLILTTALLHTQREGEGVPSLIAVQGQESPRLVMLLPLSHQQTPLTPYMRGLQYVAWTPNGLLYTALSGQGDTALYRVPKIGAKPELLADQLLARMVVSHNGEWVVVADSGGLGGNYGFRAIRTDGSERYPLTLELREDLEVNQEATPVISADGTWVGLVVFERTGDYDAYRVHMDGTGLENLTGEITGVAQIAGWSEVSQSFIINHRYVLWYWDESAGHLERLLPASFTSVVWIMDIPTAGLNLVYTLEMVQAVRRDSSLVWEQPAVSRMIFAPDGSWGIGRKATEWKRIRGWDGAVLPLNLPSTVDNFDVVWSPSLDTAIIRSLGVNGIDHWWLDMRTGDVQPILKPTPNTEVFRWSPDERYLAVEWSTLNSYRLGFFRLGDSKITWMTKNDAPPFVFFAGWGPAYEKTWSAGVLLAIGIGCIVVGIVVVAIPSWRRADRNRL